MKRRLKRFAYVTILSIGLLLSAPLILLMVPPARQHAADFALARIQDRIHGRLLVERSAWERPGRFVLNGLLWTVDADTLLNLADLRIEMDLGALVRRDLHIKRLVVDCVSADLPAIRAALPAGTEPEGGTGSGAFPRPGSLAPLPSIALDETEITCRRLIVRDHGAPLEFEARGGLELRPSRTAGLDLDLSARPASGAWSIDGFALNWRPADGLYSGRGRLSLRGAEPVRLSLDNAGPRSFTLDIAGTDPPDEAGLAATGRFTEDANGLRALHMEGRYRIPDTERLSGIEVLAGRLRSAPGLDALHGAFTLIGAWDETGPRFALDLETSPNAWQRGIRLRAEHRDGLTRLDSLGVSADGLKLTASGQLEDGSLQLHALASIDSLAWLADLDPGLASSDSLSATLILDAAGPLPRPDLSLALHGGARRDALRIDGFDSGLSLRQQWSSGRLHWSLTGHGLGAAGRARLEAESDTLRLRTTPILITSGPARLPDGETDGLIRWSPRDTSLTLSRLRLDGALGTLVADGRWSPRGGEGRIRIEWPEPPALLSRLVDAEKIAALESAWSGPAPWMIRTEVAIGPGPPSGRALSVRSDLHLPGPRRLSTIFDAGLDLQDLGPIDGRFALDARGSDLDIGLDLSRSAWIDRGRAALRIRGDVLDVDTLEFAIPGLSLEAGGQVSGSRIEGRFVALMPDASIPRRRSGLEDLEASVRIEGDLKGAYRRPALDARLSGRLRRPGFVLPGIQGRIHLDADSLKARFHLPDLVLGDRARIDTLAVEYAAGVGLRAGRISTRIAAGASRLRMSGDLRTGSVYDLTVDTLDLALDGRGAALSRPFRTVFDTRDRSMTLHDLDLSGDLGYLRIPDLRAGDDPEDIEGWADFDLHPPPALIPSNIPSDLTPESVSGDIASGNGRQSVRVDLKGLKPGGRTDVLLTADLSRTRDRIEGRATLSAPRDTLAVLHAILPGDAVQAVRRQAPVDLEANLVLRGLSVALPSEGRRDRRVVVIDGDLDLGGTTDSPKGRLDLEARVKGWEELAAHRLGVEARLAPTPGRDGQRLGIDLALDRDGARLVSGRLDLPGSAGLAPIRFTPSDSGRLAARVSMKGLRLEEFSPLLPASVGLQGVIDMEISADGPPRTAGLDGHLDFSDGRITLEDGSWITLAGRSEFSGDVDSPYLSGQLTISRGLLKLPDPPKTLHPVDAVPRLWSAAATDVPDSTSAAAGRSRGPGAANLPRADIRLTIPSGLWLRGQGVEVELVGDLDLRTLDGRPVVEGELAAARGLCRFLGRSFRIERGNVRFDGKAEIDPALDIALTTIIDGALYRIVFGGTVKRPTLSLSSEPELPEGDIMAMLLFGRPLDDLSGDQEGLVRQRATDLVTAFGTAQLEARLSQQLKVDLVTLNRNAEGGDALVIGKYIHQNVLLKYEQVLDEWSSSFVNLEYYLSRHIKVETMISRHAQSAASLNWTFEY